MSERPGARLSMYAFLAALWGLNAAVAWLEPTSALDWSHRVWAARHAGYPTSRWLLTFVGAHWRLGQLVGFVLVRAPVVHWILTPSVDVALLVGLFVAARRRLPVPGRWDDLLDLAVLSSMFWIAQPHAGLISFYRPYVASQLYGAVLAVWFLAPYLCHWRVGTAGAIALAVAGLLVGTDTPQLATGALVACAILVRRVPRAERPRWMTIGLGALFVGTALCYALRPHVELARVFRRELDVNLNLLGMPIREGGELVALVAAFVLGTVLVSKLSPGSAGFQPEPEDYAELARAPRYLVAWLALSALALFGPLYSEALLVPAILVLCVAAAPFLRVVARVRWIRGVLIALVAGTQLVVWSCALSTYVRIHGEFADRMARIARTPPGTVASIAPYSQIYPSFWFFGEDWANAAQRELAARTLFGLRDIDFSQPFRALELNPGIEVALETSASPAQLEAAHPPAPWARSLWVTHIQFSALVARLRATAPDVSARLVVQNVDFPQRAGRPLLAGWANARETFVYDARRAGPDFSDRYMVTLPPPVARRFQEAWLVHEGRAERTTIVNGRIHAQPMVTGVWATVVCAPDVCLLVDAFIPRF